MKLLSWNIQRCRGADHTVSLFDTVQSPRRFCCDFVFVSEDLAHGLRASRSTS